MTKQQAREYFKLKETDPIYEPGIRSLMAEAEEMLSIWSVSNADKEEYKRQIEACRALLD